MGGIHESDSEDDDFDVEAFINKRRGPLKYLRDADDSEDSEEDSEEEESGDNISTLATGKLSKEEKQTFIEQSSFKCEVCPHKLFLNQAQLDLHLASSVHKNRVKAATKKNRTVEDKIKQKLRNERKLHNRRLRKLEELQKTNPDATLDDIVKQEKGRRPQTKFKLSKNELQQYVEKIEAPK